MQVTLAHFETAETGPDFARLMWLYEDLIYEDLLKGTGWGRRRGWFREQLETVKTVSQVRVARSTITLACDGKTRHGHLCRMQLRRLVLEWPKAANHTCHQSDAPLHD